MATVNSNSTTTRPAKPHASPPKEPIRQRINSPEFLKSADNLLRMSLNRFQVKLNSNLLGILSTRFAESINTQQQEINTQLKNIPAGSRQRWLNERLSFDQRLPENQPLRYLYDFLVQFIQSNLDELQRLKRENQAFRKSVGKVRSKTDRQQIILHYAQQLGATANQLREDRKAFARWFDEEAATDRFLKRVGQIELELIFAFDRLGHIVNCIFELADQDYRKSDGDSQQQLDRLGALWRRLNIESRLQSALVYDGDSRVHVAAMKCLRLSLAGFPDAMAGKVLDQNTLIFVNRAAMEDNSDVWIQCEALSIVSRLGAAGDELLNHRLDHPKEGDDIFVRRHIWKIYQRRMLEDKYTNRKLHQATDPSPFVRQKKALVAFLSSHAQSHQRWMKYALDDDVPQVRAAAIMAVIDCEPTKQQVLDFLKTLCDSLEREANPFVVRTAMFTSVELLEKTHRQFKRKPSDETVHGDATFLKTLNTIYENDIVPRIFKLQHAHEKIPVRRWAAQANERIWALTDPQISDLINTLRPQLSKIRNGKSGRFSKRLFSGIDRAKLGRLFAVLAQADFGYDVEKRWFGYRVSRGFSFGFRFWRFFFEFTNTATDKRQALRHTIGRISTATLRAPSQILGELSETKVPGEPLTIGDDGTWRPFIPLLDDFVSVLNLSWLGAKTVEFYTSQGITRVKGPRRIGQRLKACFELSFRFAMHARTRNWDEDSYPASDFLKSMSRLGFGIQFEPYAYPNTKIEPTVVTVGKPVNPEESCHKLAREHSSHTGETQLKSKRDRVEQGGVKPTFQRPQAATSSHTKLNSNDDSSTFIHDETQLDPSLVRFFSAAVVAFPLLETSSLLLGTFVDSAWYQIKRFSEYFAAPFDNSLEQLVVFAGAALCFVIGKHLYSNYTFRKARQSIPLSIGGWGTRGKSGTERLKAALIGVMGHGLVSKTTGCEAMFIHGYAMGEPLEIPLFRPYDKATIWEHRNLIALGAKMDPSVFLWECMALTPSYVDVLQRQWTCDDIGTITNTYPDHEDIQGPAGHNVASTISGFVPLNGHLLTTEEMMRPYVTENCRLANTEFQGVGWLESGMITDDILERFPYQEHPDNIALVAKLAEQLGVLYEYSLKAQADYLVPDLGVLKTHPVSTVRTRKIEFTNGCSANERFGCMGNWRRLGFDTQDPWEDAGTWVCGVINNRADRVPRSKVFAKIIVEDVNADRFFLIGSNLQGLQSFISEAWTEKAETITLRDKGQPWDREFALATLKQAAWDFRQPTKDAHIEAKLKHMLKGVQNPIDAPQQLDIESVSKLWKDQDQLDRALASAGVASEYATTIIRNCQDLTGALGEYRTMRETIEDAPESIVETVEQKFKDTLKNWYRRKIIVIPNFDATGEEVIHRIVEEVPPGFLARVIGMQNIKGTGLDFVYRFQAWDVCNDACDALASRNPQVAERAVTVLSSMPAIGQLCQSRVAQAIHQARSNNALKRADLQAQLDVLEKRLAAEVLKYSSSSKLDDQSNGKDQGRSRLNQWLLDSAEQFLDVSDSLRRRDKADVIYRDLAACRISRQRAVVELRKINKRQKGGWLTSYYDSQLGEPS